MDREKIAAIVSGDGMPLGNETTLPIRRDQITVDPGGPKPVMFDDDAAATIVWNDFMRAMNWIDTNSWLMEWQYVDYLYQSPNYDRDWRTHTSRPARISRFNVAKNSNTMSNQIRRSIFADKNFFVLEPQGKMAGSPDAQTYLDAWTEIFTTLCDRADFEYHFGRLFVKSQALQGTGIGIPRWEEKTVIRTRREPKAQPVQISMPLRQVKIHTWESDDWKVIEEEVKESWPAFEYRRLGTTIWDEKWRTPGRPDLSATSRFDVDYVNFADLDAMRELDCYKDIPKTEDLLKFFLNNGVGDAEPMTEVAQNMNSNAAIVEHAEGENAQISVNPLEKPLLKIAQWQEKTVKEILVYNGRRKVIRNEAHDMGDHALGYSANWYDIENSGYGFGIGRLNAGDQRMSQGVLNEALKMIAFPMNAPLLYDRDSGNAPTQNTIAGLGTYLGVSTGPSRDINKALGFLKVPEIPSEAWRIYELATAGGEDLVGANQTTMQGQLGGAGSSFGRTAAGVNRLSSKADENISDPVSQAEEVINRFLQFLWKMVLEQMPIKEIREILSDKFGEAILEQIDARKFLNFKFSVRVLAGQKLAARAAIAQLIPFLLQLVQQPQLLEFMHQKGWTVNYLTIEKLFMQMSELAGREDIIVPLTPQEKQMVQAMQPGIQRIQQLAMIEKLKGANKIQEIHEQGNVDVQKSIAEKAMDHVDGSVPLELAEARTSRNTDMGILSNGIPEA